METLIEMNKKLNYSIILTGDFNLSPNHPTYYYLTTNNIPIDNLNKFLTPADHNDPDMNSLTKVVSEGVNGWKHRNREPESQEDFNRLEEVSKILESSKNFPPMKSLYSDYRELMKDRVTYNETRWVGEPPFTSYATWKGVIDYIFVWPVRDEKKKSLIPTKIREIPPEEFIKELVGLPNDFYASDHFYIQAEFVLQ